MRRGEGVTVGGGDGGGVEEADGDGNEYGEYRCSFNLDKKRETRSEETLIVPEFTISVNFCNFCSCKYLFSSLTLALLLSMRPTKILHELPYKEIVNSRTIRIAAEYLLTKYTREK